MHWLPVMLRLVASIRPRGKHAFLLRHAGANGRSGNKCVVVDIGCGNDSPAQAKALIDCYYIGVDVADYHQRSSHLADEYVICTPETFNATLAGYENRADIVISSHNLEHCLDPDTTLDLMCAMLKPGGVMFLAFPCEESVDFPSRRGTLNFYDDTSHRTVPRFLETQERLGERLTTVYACKRYQPAIPYWIGFALEPLSALTRRVMPLRSTWAYYGFESIIWAYKPAAADVPSRQAATDHRSTASQEPLVTR